MSEFRIIYEEFQPKILRYLRRLVGEDDAADLTQTVFLKVSKSLPGFRGDSSVSTWIYRIATNAARDHSLSSLRKQKQAEVPIEDAAHTAESITCSGPGPDEEHIRQEMNACIRGIVDKLPETYRVVLVLAEFKELKDQEVADILGISLENMKVRLHRARLAMRKAMQCQCSFYHDRRNVLMCDRR